MASVAQGVAHDIDCKMKVDFEALGELEHRFNDATIVAAELGHFKDDSTRRVASYRLGGRVLLSPDDLDELLARSRREAIR